MIETDHFLHIVENINHVKNYVDQMLDVFETHLRSKYHQIKGLTLVLQYIF